MESPPPNVFAPPGQKVQEDDSFLLGALGLHYLTTAHQAGGTNPFPGYGHLHPTRHTHVGLLWFSGGGLLGRPSNGSPGSFLLCRHSSPPPWLKGYQAYK